MSTLKSAPIRSARAKPQMSDGGPARVSSVSVLSDTLPEVVAQFPVWSPPMRAYLRQQIAQASNAKERADAIRLAQKLANA